MTTPGSAMTEFTFLKLLQYQTNASVTVRHFHGLGAYPYSGAP